MVDEQKRFEVAAKNFWTGNVFMLCLYTGPRIGEALALAWVDVELDDTGNETVRVNKTQCCYGDYSGEKAKTIRTIGSTKTKSSVRTVSLVPKIVGMLRPMRGKRN